MSTQITTPASPTTPPGAAPVTTPGAGVDAAQARRTRTSRHVPLTYLRTELAVTARGADTVFFCLLMPLGMYLIFGRMSGFEGTSVGAGNVTANIMASMATYSAAIAATCAAASAAIDLAGGWGRQVALTRCGVRGYVTVKAASAVILAIIPVAVILAVGAATGARIDSQGRWALTALACLSSAVPFALYGLLAGLAVPSPRTVGMVGSSVAALAFLANVFVPLSGILLSIGRWTPLYGPAALAHRVFQGDVVATATGTVHECVWVGAANLVGWTLVLLVACLVARRRQLGRR